MSDKTDLEKVISVAGEAIGTLLKYDPKEGERLFKEMAEVLLKEHSDG
jgi:hypothetical protein